MEVVKENAAYAAIRVHARRRPRAPPRL